MLLPMKVQALMQKNQWRKRLTKDIRIICAQKLIFQYSIKFTSGGNNNSRSGANFKELITGDQYKNTLNKCRKTNVFEEGENVIVFFHKMRFPISTYNKSQPSNNSCLFK